MWNGFQMILSNTAAYIYVSRLFPRSSNTDRIYYSWDLAVLGDSYYIDKKFLRLKNETISQHKGA